MAEKYTFKVNGYEAIPVTEADTLIDVLREELNLGTKRGCDNYTRGACSNLER